MRHLAAALAYAKLGLAVFPCKEAAKKPPLTKKGYKDATTSEERIRAWWTKWPAANVCIATGQVSGGLVVLDIDNKNGVDGEASLRGLLNGRELPDTREVRTPSGGRHLYFRVPKGVEVKSSAGKLGPGLDVRGDDGYLVAPPSALPGGEYETKDANVTVKQLPSWLLLAMTGGAARTAPKRSAPIGQAASVE